MSRVRTPFAPLYHTVVPLAGLVFRIKSGFVPDRRAQMPRKGPFVLLSNHASNYDFLYAFPQVWPRRMNAVVSQHFFGTRFLGWLLRVMGCIPIKQFTSDPSAVRDILAVIRAGRGLLLFPEAEVSGQGRSGPFLPSLPRLLKKLKAPVYFMQICGAYLTAPKWAKTLRRGRVETQIFQLFSADALARASEAEISDALMGALRYDESEWQQTARIPFKGRRLAEGLHNMLHRCPRCHALYTGETQGNLLRCTVCANTVCIDEYGFLHPVTPEDRAYESISKWVAWQQDCIRKQAQAGEFQLTTPAEIRVNDTVHMQKHVPAGQGILTLTAEGFVYEGTLRAKQVSLRFPIDKVFKCPFRCGKDFEIPNTSEILAFAPEDGRMVSAFVQAVPVLRELAKKG